MTKVSPQQLNLALIEEGQASRQLLAEFGIRLDEEMEQLLRRAHHNYQNGTLTTDKSQLILGAMLELHILKSSWINEIARGDRAANKEYTNG